MPRTRLVAHPFVEGFPIETALRRLVNGNKSTPTVRDLAHTALVQGNTEALWGLHDALEESGHPWANLYNWRAAADKLHLDRVTHEALRDEAERVRHGAGPHALPWTSSPERAAQVAAMQLAPRHPASPYNGDPSTLARIRQGVRDRLPDVHQGQIDESIRRHAYRSIRTRNRLFGIKHDIRPDTVVLPDQPEIGALGRDLKNDPLVDTAPRSRPGSYLHEHDYLNHKATRYARRRPDAETVSDRLRGILGAPGASKALADFLSRNPHIPIHPVALNLLRTNRSPMWGSVHPETGQVHILPQRVADAADRIGVHPYNMANWFNEAPALVDRLLPQHIANLGKDFVGYRPQAQLPGGGTVNEFSMVHPDTGAHLGIRPHGTSPESLHLRYTPSGASTSLNAAVTPKGVGDLIGSSPKPFRAPLTKWVASNYPKAVGLTGKTVAAPSPAPAPTAPAPAAKLSRYAKPRPGPFANLRGHPLGQNPDVVRTLYRLWKSTPQMGEAGRPVRALVEGIMRDPWRGTRYSALRARLQDVGHPYGNFPEWDQAAALIGRQKRVKDAVDWLSRAKRIDTTGLGNPTNPDIGGIAERVAAQVGGDVKRRDVLDHFRTFRLNPRQGAISPWAFEHQAKSFRRVGAIAEKPEERGQLPEAGVPEGPFKFRRRRYAAPSNGTFLDALRRASSRQQKGLHEVAKTVVRKLGLAPAQVSPVVHDAPGRSTPGVATAVYGGWGNPEAVRSAASWLGLYTRSPGMGVFHVRPAGPDAIYRMRLFGAGNEIRARLDRSGIGQRLLIPHRRGFDVVVPDKGGGQYRAVRAFSEQQGVPMEMSRGHFQTIGASDPGDARAKFRGTIQRQEG